LTQAALMTAPQVAEVLGVHPNYVYALAQSGDIPSFKVGGVRRFMWSEVLSWLDTKRA
jgi:excisionase family DNA binding protein